MSGRRGGLAAPEAWVNELHDDDSGTDRGEGGEIAGTAGLDLAGWTVELYNGADGALYDTIALSGTIDGGGPGWARCGLRAPGSRTVRPTGWRSSTPRARSWSSGATRAR